MSLFGLNWIVDDSYSFLCIMDLFGLDCDFMRWVVILWSGIVIFTYGLSSSLNLDPKKDSNFGKNWGKCALGLLGLVFFRYECFLVVVVVLDDDEKKRAGRG